MSGNSAFGNPESDTTGADDPVGCKIAWTPASRGGSNFTTHRLDVSGRRIRVQATGALTLFGFAFVALAMAQIAVMGIPAIREGEYVFGVFTTAFGLLFAVAGWRFAHAGKSKLLTFDKSYGRYFDAAHQNRREPPEDRSMGGKLSDIYAIQIVPERVVGSETRYTSYELNLVFPDGERVTVMDHGNVNEIRKAAWTLGRFLKVPVWEKSMASAPDRRTRATRRATSGVFALVLLLGIGSAAIGFLYNGDNPNSAEHGGYPAQQGAHPKMRERVRAVEWLPDGAFDPDFCSFSEVTTGRNGEKTDIWGTTSLPIMEAGNRVHAYMRHTTWEPDGVIKQADAAALSYRRGDTQLNYLFLLNSGEPNRCLVSWKTTVGEVQGR